MFFHASVANTISVIKVGYIAKHANVRVPLVRKNEPVLNKLVELGAIACYSCELSRHGRFAQITLAYINGRPAINGIAYIGHQGEMASVKHEQLVVYRKASWNATILSTSRGLLTIEEAVAAGVGGFPLITITY